jgi:flagellar biosynthetic protein FliP
MEVWSDSMAESTSSKLPPTDSRFNTRVKSWRIIGLMLCLFAAPLIAAEPANGLSRSPTASPNRGASAETREQQLLEPNAATAESQSAAPAGLDVEKMLSPGGLSSTLKIMLMLTVLSLAPSILIMTTSFIRFVIVLGLLRQALGTQQLPPNQVIVSLSLFLTLLIMAPVWKQSYNEGIRPYTSPEPGRAAVTLEEAYTTSAAAQAVHDRTDRENRQRQASGCFSSSSS